MPGSFAPAASRRRRGFALVITLLIVSVLAIIAVSYLASTSAERQTADAYAARARALQAAQTGVDSATAILSESFRDFPDSVTAWDPQQTTNTGTPSNAAVVVNTPYNEGTNLYLRAVAVPNTIVPTASGGTTTVTAANPSPTPSSSPAAANDPGGNNPNNPACQNFVLPLVSGVPGGRAQLVTNKSSILPAVNLSQTDPTQQNYTDLNIRRFSGDLQGVIGSPPTWTTTAPAPVGPKPARALWVNMKGSDGRLTGRYAFWVEDESFRANLSYVSNPTVPTARPDNSANGVSMTDSSGNIRSILPSDMSLLGILAPFDSGNASSDASQLVATRAVFPGSFLPAREAFLQSTTSATGSSGYATAVADGLRYLTTTQSGSLNLTRHGSQRMNLNATTTINPSVPVTMPEIRKLVEAIRFHLPNFGQRFYRSTNPYASTTPATILSTILNDATSNYGVPTMTNRSGNDEIYLYKTAANLRDYIDTDDQPTMIVRPTTAGAEPTLALGVAPVHPFGGDGSGGNGTNYMWAQGKDGAPFLQEAVVRYRPAVQNDGTNVNYTLTVDYYLEFWNMSDHDVTAYNLGHNPFVRVSNQQAWYSATVPSDSTGTKPMSGAVPTYVAPLTSVSATDPETAGSITPRDFDLDLINGVYSASNPSVAVSTSTGVVFKAGTATVVTTDPDFVAGGPTNAPVVNSKFEWGSQALSAAGFYSPNVYYCSKALQQTLKRVYSGPALLKPGSSTNQLVPGIMPYFRGTTSSAGTFLDYEVEVTMGNDLGYIDCAVGPVSISSGGGDGGGVGYDFTYTAASSGQTANDYLQGGYLVGNYLTPSQLGDPRTNNEQLVFTVFNGTSIGSQPDQTRYESPSEYLAPPYSLGLPNSNHVQPASASSTSYPWSDYFNWTSALATSTYPTASLTAATAPSVIADSALTSIGQLGDIFDPVRVIGTVGTFSINNSRGGGRTLKIGQRDDRFTYDASGNASPNNTVNNVPASNGWASWRLTDVFCIADPLELPGRININGVPRDGGAALNAALTGFTFQPATTVDPLIHDAPNLAGTTLQSLTSLQSPQTATSGVAALVSQITNRLALSPTVAYNAGGKNTPWGPFFERGELGELENAAAGSAVSGNTNALFGKDVVTSFNTTNTSSTSLCGVDLNHTFDRGREELFRRLAELICTRGDTFTVYSVGESLSQATVGGPVKITGTQRLRVTFRLVPKQYTAATGTGTGTWDYFHPGYTVDSSADQTITGPTSFDPESATSATGINQRFAKPDRYDVQILEVSPY